VEILQASFLETKKGPTLVWVFPSVLLDFGSFHFSFCDVILAVFTAKGILKKC